MADGNPGTGAGASDGIVDIIVEIPAGGRNKYEYDHDLHVIRLDRRLFTATAYPTDYGFVPETLALDGDPLDAMVLLADPTFPGCMVRMRVLGVFWMRDEKGPDAKLLGVLEHDPNWDHVVDLEGLPDHLLAEIEHFFTIYKDLEPGKTSYIGGFEGKTEALRELDECRVRYRTLRAEGPSETRPEGPSETGCAGPA
ncbi:MAG TPA: inorganic diphosphatase [Acidimicrobiales bacterium]|nr:inorganic diphosphatase [Acidimicrobiales bacterium]